MENNEKLPREECIDKRMENLIRKPFLTDKECEELETMYKKYYKPSMKTVTKLSITLDGDRQLNNNV